MRQRRNAAEKAFEEWALAQGWTVGKRGWPDFWCETPNGFAAVEVKPDRSQGPGCLKFHQRKILKALAAHGVIVWVWTPKGGLIPLESPRVRDAASGE